MTKSNDEVNWYDEYMKEKAAREKAQSEFVTVKSQRDSFKRQVQKTNQVDTDKMLKELEEENAKLKKDIENDRVSRTLEKKKDAFLKMARKEGLTEHFENNMDLLNIDYSKIDLESVASVKAAVKGFKDRLPTAFTKAELPPAPGSMANEKLTDDEKLEKLYKEGKFTEFTKLFNETKKNK